MKFQNEISKLKKARGANKRSITETLQDIDEFLQMTMVTDNVGKKLDIERNFIKVMELDDQILEQIPYSVKLVR